MKKLICSLLVVQFLLGGVISSAFAEGDDDIIKNTQNDIILVGAAGAAGAVLGLSTLSFVDDPSSHVSNILTGAALGVIAGVVFVAYQSAQKGSEDLQSSIDFNSSERVAWHVKNTQILTSPQVQFGSTLWQTNF